MSCPHQELFSCPDCIKEGLVKDQTPPGEIIRLRAENVRLREGLRAIYWFLTVATNPEEDGEGCGSANVRQAMMIYESMKGDEK